MEQTTSTTSTGESAHGLLDRVRSGATAQLSTQKDRATESLGNLAQAVRQSTQPLREHKQDMVAEYIEKAADQLDRLSTRLRERNINDLAGDVQQFARRQPAVFIGAAFAAGLIAARFLKSSSEGRHYATASYGSAPRREDRFSSQGFDSPQTTQYSGGGL